MKLTLLSTAKATALVAVAFASLPETGHAMPASPFPISAVQPDGSVIDVRVHGDENYHMLTTADCTKVLTRDGSGMLTAAGDFDQANFERNLDRARRKQAPARILGSDGFPAHGKQRALAILVEYPETEQRPQGRRFSLPDPRQHFDDLLNKPGYDTDGATGSVYDYFLDSSSGVLELTFDVFGPVTLEHDLSYYTALTNGENLSAWHMAEEACRLLDGQIDFTEYDRDRNGVIDNVYIFYAGEGGATSATPEDCIWQHAADIERITGKQFLFDGVRLNHYACSNEYRLVRNTSTGEMVRQAEGIGTVCHEFSHVLGLPDFYDTGTGGVYTPGLWALMDTGCHLNDSRTPPYYTAIERYLMGWIDPVVIGKQPQSLSLRDISNNEAYRIDTHLENEYFLLENRQLKGWDAFLPGHGMLIWHVNYSADYWNANQVNTRPESMGLDIVRADGSKGSLDGDTFPGTQKVTSISDEGYPNLLTLNATPTNAPLSRITEAGGIITFDVCKAVSKLDKVDGLRVENVTPGGFTAVWNQTHQSAGYVFNLFTRDGGGEAEPVGMYHDLNVATTSLTVSGLDEDSDYYFTVRAVAGGVSGETSDEFKVHTPPMSFEFSSPAAVEISEVTSASFKASWLPLEGAVDYSVLVYTKEPGEPVVGTADFTGGVESLPAGWSTNCSITMSMNGYYGEAAPSLSMPEDYGRIQSPLLPAELCGLQFWYRERSGSGEGRIEISVLDGSQWTQIDRIDLPDRMSEGAVYTLPADKILPGSVAVRIVYRRGTKGSLAIDDIKVSHAGESVRTPLEGWASKELGSASTQVVVGPLAPMTDYYFKVRGIDADGAKSMSSDEVKVTTLEQAGISETVSEEVSVTVTSDGMVTVDGTDRAVSVYDLQGRPVQMPLPARGIYLLRAGSEMIKIKF